MQPKPVNQLQQRRSMPPSPLLQATHLVHNDSGTAHADSLDRFFETKVGDARSCSNSCKTSSRSQRRDKKKNYKKKSPKDNDKATRAVSNSPEEKSYSRTILKRRNTSRKSLKSENSKSKSLTVSHHSHEIDGDIEQEEKHNIVPIKEDTNKLEEAGSQTQLPHKSNEQAVNLSDKESECAAASTIIHSEMTPTPKFGYTADNPATVNLDHIVSAIKPASIEQHSKYLNLVSTEGISNKTGGHIPHDTLTTNRETVDRDNNLSSKLHKLGQTAHIVEERVEGTIDVCIRNRKEDDDRNGLVDEQNSQRQEESTPSDNSGLQHRLFACKIQSGSGQVNHTELLPLKTISTSRGCDRYSPGPPPLEFNKDRPQRMWGHDSTQPISLTHALTHPTTSPKEDNIIEPSLISPKPPDYPPPKHYTLLAARRKRFRRPGKT